MKYAGQLFELTKLTLLSLRQTALVFVAIIQVVLAVGLVLGYGYLIPDISDTAAFYVTTGAATNAIVTRRSSSAGDRGGKAPGAD
jgi:hypothetical protein